MACVHATSCGVALILSTDDSLTTISQPSIQLRMQLVESRGLLVGAGEGGQRCVLVVAAEERDRDRRARAADVVLIARVRLSAARGASSPRKPLGTMMAGCPVRLVATNCWPNVGVTITSTCSKSAETCCTARVRARLAWMYSTAG